MVMVLDILAVLSAALPWARRLQLRRLEQLGSRVPFSDASREVLERAGHLAVAEGAEGIDPVHIAMAVLERPEHRALAAAESNTGESVVPVSARHDVWPPYTHEGLRVLVESVVIAADAQCPEATPGHLLQGVLRRRPKRAREYLAARGVRLERFAGQTRLD